MNLLDLFSGIGGFSLAARWMDWQTVAFVEKEPFCQHVPRKNFGTEIPIYDDITTFSGKPFRGSVDIISGGFPSQPFSVAGTRKGEADERYLFPQMLRVISEVKPRWVVAENVRGLLSISNGRVYADVIASLERIGYEVVTFCIPASAVEAPHRRDRLWIVAHADNERAYSRPKEIQRANEEIFQWHTNAQPCDTNSQYAPDAENVRRIRRPDESQDRERQLYSGCRDDRTFGEPAISYQGIAGFDRDADSVGLQGQRQEYNDTGSVGLSNRKIPRWTTHWASAATRFCGMDDGLPDELDIIGARDNRSKRIHALGNAIVPQIAFEIFQAIERTERGNVNDTKDKRRV